MTMSEAQVIVVPAAGLGEKFVREALGLDRGQLLGLVAAELGAPRDYHWTGTAYSLHAAGIRRLGEVLQLDLEVREEGAAQAPRGDTAAPRHHHGDRANGYQLEED